MRGRAESVNLWARNSDHHAFHEDAKPGKIWPGRSYRETTLNDHQRSGRGVPTGTAGFIAVPWICSLSTLATHARSSSSGSNTRVAVTGYTVPSSRHLGPAVADYHAGPTLQIAHATAQIEFSGARRHTVEVYRIGQKAADLNLTQRDIIGEGPVSNLFVGLLSEQQPAGREIAGAGDRPPQEHDDRQTYSYGRNYRTELSSREPLFPLFTR